METYYTSDRDEWRGWLGTNCRMKEEIWFVFPVKASGEAALSYNDAVEEALCFGWIDSTCRRLDDLHCVRRFTPRRKGSPYSRPNIERLIRMDGQGKLTPEVRESVRTLLETPFVYPEDILDELRGDAEVWKNYLVFPEPYRRIRVAYIEDARKRPEEFAKRLRHFMDRTRRGRMITGYGGIDTYYG